MLPVWLTARLVGLDVLPYGSVIPTSIYGTSFMDFCHNGGSTKFELAVHRWQTGTEHETSSCMTGSGLVEASSSRAAVLKKVTNVLERDGATVWAKAPNSYGRIRKHGAPEPGGATHYPHQRAPKKRSSQRNPTNRSTGDLTSKTGERQRKRHAAGNPRNSWRTQKLLQNWWDLKRAIKPNYTQKGTETQQL
ncbi:uncharacterized protein BDR25DRAFT_317957 [Lindgomyces ingoldianus]|uniref:Uncharacterized protein n=1 Tax=Lindgomyces ingoldianus TaxID=673940 RepID=A0ACB6QGW4_9PLEO|nr:uncharacterized protein BDR25DRAFT_317957 [Lindgomyces ingoldianus]KAF2466164.1 hypothetical protein BDR25DRAFT_317957 [Lindgomyces ingoldianus]